MIFFSNRIFLSKFKSENLKNTNPICFKNTEDEDIYKQKK